ncbi:hypothetical protein VOLCADRAFT_105812 [Volvox carteri f. nagariensis]|uniref:Uncharacterized protein n=1 Tax=Volvox carteri f. nagariensis TaxID=3068 RepID=D8U3A1_VOLCA|nr:uncharacterized protein VOLCADRAFT_105812 [Volvox carteri f. nagariensis]EFJ45790.1 hypothetical protein VOLCADRAFT_105812 [Volvox carteri f. nagariensis]|eukprot:XP_002953191.1 hypothetical protein VOLCADRAFT_105812 [Volvox carteri f. nagariensis]
MTTVLFVGGVSPDLTLEDLGYAFSQGHVELLASSIVCVKANGGTGGFGSAAGKCVGQAYVTVRSEDVPRALEVCQVGANGVLVLPVDVKAWVKPEVAEAVVTAAMTAAPAAHVAALAPPSSPGAAPAPAPAAAIGVGGSLELSGVRVLTGGAVPASPTSSQSGGGGGGAAPSATSHPQLQAVMDQLRALLTVNPWLSYNRKTHFTLLNEVCQKRQLSLQAVESLGSLEGTGGPFVATTTITATSTGEVVCTGVYGGGKGEGRDGDWAGYACGSSKRDAKHNSAASCLEQMLAMGMVPPTELLSAMTCQAANSAGAPAAAAVAAAAGGGGGGGGPAGPPSAAKSALSLTSEIMRLGAYPRCEEVMRQVHATDQGRLKTILMVLNEYATRIKVAHQEIQHQEITLPPGPVSGSPSGLGWRFKFRSSLVNTVTGQVLAQAEGAEFRSKQEAKQSAAAALIEHMLAHNLATAEAVRGGK